MSRLILLFSLTTILNINSANARYSQGNYRFRTGVKFGLSGDINRIKLVNISEKNPSLEGVDIEVSNTDSLIPAEIKKAKEFDLNRDSFVSLIVGGLSFNLERIIGSRRNYFIGGGIDVNYGSASSKHSIQRKISQKQNEDLNKKVPSIIPPGSILPIQAADKSGAVNSSSGDKSSLKDPNTGEDIVIYNKDQKLSISEGFCPSFYMMGGIYLKNNIALFSRLGVMMRSISLSGEFSDKPKVTVSSWRFGTIMSIGCRYEMNSMVDFTLEVGGLYNIEKEITSPEGPGVFNNQKWKIKGGARMQGSAGVFIRLDRLF